MKRVALGLLFVGLLASGYIFGGQAQAEYLPPNLSPMADAYGVDQYIPPNI